VSGPVRPALLCIALLCAPVRPARAEEVSQAAKEWYLKGADYYAEGHPLAAARAFLQAYRICKKGNLLYNIGAAYESAGDNEKAYDYYGRFLEAAWDAPNAGEVRQARDRLEKLIVAGYPRLTVNTSPQGAALYLDSKAGDSAGKSPATFPVRPGAHKVIAEKEGFALEMLDIEVVKDTPQSVTIPLKKSAGKGKVRLQIAPLGAEVTVDGESVGRAPFGAPLSLAEGSHWVTVKAPDHKAWTGTLLVTPDRVAELVVELTSTLPPEPFPYRHVSAYVGGGALALLAGAGVFAWLAQDLHDELTAQRSRGEPLASSDLDLGESYVSTEVALLGVGGVAAATAVAFYLLGNDERAEGGDVRALRLLPTGAWDQAGLVLDGRF